MDDRLFPTDQRHNLSPWIGLGLFLILSILVGIRLGHTQAEGDASRVAVLVSKHIKPYMEAADGLERYLQDQNVSSQIILIQEKDRLQQDSLVQQLIKGDYQAAVAIGPQATSFLWTIPELSIPTLFSMVLRPEKAVGNSQKRLCGVSLSIPVDIQLQSIEHSLPGHTRIGLLFHPDHNHSIYYQAQLAANDMGLHVVPLKILDQGDVSQVLAEYLDHVDVLWIIPDRALNSKTVVEYIIKQALYAQVPVIGYNRFFHESGAAVSFIFDYHQIGLQTGRLLIRSMEQGWCEVQPAEFEVWKHERIYKMLDLEHD